MIVLIFALAILVGALLERYAHFLWNIRRDRRADRKAGRRYEEKVRAPIHLTDEALARLRHATERDQKKQGRRS